MRPEVTAVTVYGNTFLKRSEVEAEFGAVDRLLAGNDHRIRFVCFDDSRHRASAGARLCFIGIAAGAGLFLVFEDRCEDLTVRRKQTVETWVGILAALTALAIQLRMIVVVLKTGRGGIERDIRTGVQCIDL